MSSKIKIAASTTALAAMFAVPVAALSAGPADADPVRVQPLNSNQGIITVSGMKAPTVDFGQTVIIDGFKITIKHKHDGKEGKYDARPGHYSELVTIYVKPTKHHKHWGLRWKQHARYGRNHQVKATIDDGEGFGKVDRTWYAWTRVGVGKQHYARHFAYTFTFKGHKVHWVNDRRH